jgi:hypothetical protein
MLTGCRPAAEIILTPDTAWQLFTKALSPDEARPQAQLSGDAALAEPALSMIAVMA